MIITGFDTPAIPTTLSYQWGEETTGYSLEKVEEEMMHLYSLKVKEYQAPSYRATLKDINSKWRVSSALQKSIRRGFVEESVRYAQALINGGAEEYFWNRIPIIAMEDIGVANIELCSFVLWVSRFKAHRNKFQSFNLPSFIVEEMAKSPKSRTLCDLMCSVEYDPDWEVKTENKMFEAIRGALHEDAKKMGMFSHSKDPKVFKEHMFFINTCDYPLFLKFIIETGGKKNLCNLHLGVRAFYDYRLQLSQEKQNTFYLHDEAPKEFPEKVGGIPHISYDKHTLEGKRVLSYIMKSLSIKDRTPMRDTTDLSFILFQTESALLNNRLFCPVAHDIREGNDIAEVPKHLTKEDVALSKEFLRSEEFAHEILRVRKRIVTGEK